MDREGYSPSLQEIAKSLKLSAVSTAHYHVETLAKKGLVSKRWNANRSLELVESSGTIAVCVPLLGTIAAGHPIEAIENNETIELPPSLMGRQNTFVLKVCGDSMMEEHIRDGDLVVVESRDVADNGETVVALLSGTEATLKKFYREKNGRIRLQPANPKYPPIFCRAEECQIQGVVIAILRKFKTSS